MACELGVAAPVLREVDCDSNEVASFSVMYVSGKTISYCDRG